MQKRILSLVLCLVTFITTISVGFVNVSASDVSPTVLIMQNDKKVSSITLPDNEKATVSAKCEDIDEPEFKWQILADMNSDLWVDIQGMRESEIEISKALVASVMDKNNSAYIRACTTFEGEKIFSEPLCITITQAKQAPTSLQKRSAAGKPVAADENSTDPLADDDNVYVIIRYLDATSKQSIWAEYRSQLKKDDGFTFDNTILSPIWLGFTPFYCEEDTDTDDPTRATTPANQLHIKLDNQHDEDVVYNVYYKAAQVPYEAHFKYQNIYDDEYTEDTNKRQKSTAETGTIVDDDIFREWGDTEGFSALYHYPEAVAADGSTVFDCFYDRNYYLMKFDMDGGFGTEPIYAKYQTPFFVNTPTKPGYKFMGWDLLNEKGEGDGVANPLPAEIPAEEQSYKALWERTTTNYTTVYWLENPDKPDEYLFWGYRTDTANSEEIVNVNPSPNGANGITDPNEIRCSSYNANKSDKQITVKGDGSSVANVYYTRNVYTLVFYQANAGNNYNDNLCGKEEHTHTADCLICGMTEHTHSKSCYTVTGNTGGNRPQNTTLGAVVTTNNQINDYESSTADKNGVKSRKQGNNPTTYAIKLADGKYYTILNYNVNNFKIEITCGLQEHTHTAECYSCGLEEHKHTTACKNGYTGAAVTHPRVLFTIKAKYGQYIGDQWPMPDMAEEYLPAGSHFNTWQHRAEDNSKTENQTSKILNMPEDFCFTGGVKKLQLNSNTINHKWHLYYLIESFDQSSPADGVNRRLYNGTYYDVDTDYNQDIFYNTATWSAKSIKGVTNTGIEYRNASGTDSDAYFYYKRNVHDLTFTIYGEEKKTNPNIPFGADISNTNFEPDYPEKLEKNAYTFGGWYTTNECIPGSEFKFEGATMPDKAGMLYAKWVPVKHKVNFFLSEDLMNDYINGTSSEEPFAHKDVPHGNNTGSVQPTSPGGDTVFKGWFYYENEQKKRYTPENHPVIRDMNVFAEWGSNVAQPYVVHYVLLPDKDTDPSSLTEEERHNLTQVAEDSTGYAYQTSTKTFSAKSGTPFNQLYPEYNEGYFPTYASTSITVKSVSDVEHPIENEVWFYYVQHIPVPYIVRYVDAETGMDLRPPKLNADNKNAVVTERFIPIRTYLPDSIYKRLILQYDKDHIYDEEHPYDKDDPHQNVITFYYTKNENRHPYIVHHMFENPGHPQGTTSDAEYYTIFDDNNELTNDNFFEFVKTEATTDNREVKITPRTAKGFTVIDDYSRHFRKVRASDTEDTETNPILAADNTFTVTMSATGTGDAAELYVYYNLEEYPYTVKYLKYGTNPEEEIVDSITVPGNEYGTTVTEQAKDLTNLGWALASSESIDLEISENEEFNVIKFYYIPLQYQVQYLVWNKGGGKVSLETETKTSKPEDVFVGSVPTADEGYRFDGWYTDAECTKSVTASWVDGDNRIIPDKNAIKPAPSTENIYYAKFVELTGDLTIKRESTADEGEGNQVFVYKVSNQADPSLVIYVSIEGDGEETIKNLRYGDYTVEQVDEWSWRYPDDKHTVHHNNASTDVVFNKTADKEYWLSGNSAPVKNVKGRGQNDEK